MPTTSEKSMSGIATPGQQGLDFESLLEAVPDALLGVDRAGVIRYLNRHAELLFGYHRDDLVGRLIETLVPDSVRPGHPAHREGYFAGPVTRRPTQDQEGTVDKKPASSPVCLRGRQRDGTEFPLNLSLSQIDTEDGLLVIAAVRALTDRQQLDAMSRPAANAHTSPDAMISIGPDGVITSWNPAAEKMYGYRSEEMIGKSGWVMTAGEPPG